MWVLVLILGIKLKMSVWFWVVYSIILTLKILHWLGCVMQEEEE